MDALGTAVLIIFVGTYLVISTEKVNRTGTALLGMSLVGLVLMIGFLMGFEDGVTFSDFAHHIDWATILFVMSMMIIVGVSEKSGIFQYMALRLSKPSGGDHRHLFITFIVFVFFMSLFFDTTSTMLIMAPLTIEVCKALEIDFKPFLVCESLVCNFASIPSIVGAVPNLIIAQKTNLDPGFLFISFMPLSIILLLVTLPIMMKWYSKTFKDIDDQRVEIMFDIVPDHMIRNKLDFYASILAIITLVVGFSLGPSFGIRPPLISLFLAALMLILSHEHANEYLSEVGWDTIFFLVGLFGLVLALELTGLIDELADVIGTIIGDNGVVATIFLVWIPAMLSAFLDNLPVALVLSPIAIEYASLSPVLPLALVFAVNIGGYLFTPLGSPANMVSMGYAEKENDHIPFTEFAKIGTVLGLIHLLIGSVWLLLLMFLIG